MHMVDVMGGSMSSNIREREAFADLFARNHWAYKKASNYAKDKINVHQNQFR